MENLSLDQKLIKLTNDRKHLDFRFRQIQGDIDDLEEKKDSVGCEIDDLDRAIEKIKEQIRSSVLYSFSEDKFTNDFIKASYFALKDDDTREYFRCVYIADEELMATDSYRGIIIKCDVIPEQIKNSLIQWDIRESFKKYKKEIDGKYPDLKGIIQKIRDTHKKVMEDIKATDFYTVVEMQPIPTDEEMELVSIQCAEFKVILNKRYLDEALICFSGESFSIHMKDEKSPILLESGNISVAIVPLRINY